MTSFGLAVAAERLQLFRYAMRLCGNRDDAEDLVQDTMFLALRAEHQFKDGTNLAAWLTTIMRNCRFDSRRIRRANTVVEDADGHHTLLLAGAEDQAAAYEARDALSHLGDLSAKLGRALMMAADGLSMHDMAVQEGVSEGTIKSRVHRARVAFSDLIGGTP